MKLVDKKRPYPHYKFPSEVNIEYLAMTDDKCKWHNVPLGSNAIRCVHYGWFPTGVLMGTVKGWFTDTHNIGANIGNNMGTASISVVNIKEAIKMLNDAGYNNIIEGKPLF